MITEISYEERKKITRAFQRSVWNGVKKVMKQDIAYTRFGKETIDFLLREGWLYEPREGLLMPTWGR